MKINKIFILFYLVPLISCEKGVDWSVYGGSYERTQFVNSDKLNIDNISKLNKVWDYSTADSDDFSQIQTNPLIINGKFYGLSPKLKLFSLEAKSGSEIWVFDRFNSDDNFFENDVLLCHTDQMIGASTDNTPNQSSIIILYQLTNLVDIIFDKVFA